MIHLVLSVLIGFGYAWAFEAVWQKAGWQLLLAAAHWAIGELVFPIIARIIEVCGLIDADGLEYFFRRAKSREVNDER